MTFKKTVQTFLMSTGFWINPESGVSNSHKKNYLLDKDQAHHLFHYKDYLGTPFLFGCLKNKPGLVEGILGFPKIDPNIRDRDNMTALMHLARSSEDDHLNVANIFLKHPKIEINAVDNQDKTAFHYAIDANNIRLAEQLINHEGIDLQAGHTRLFAHAVKAKKWSLLNHFFKKSEKLVDHENRTILMHMILQEMVLCSTDAIKKLPQDILQLQDTAGNTALHYAVTHNRNENVITALLDKAPDLIHIRNKNGITPFAMVCQQPNINILNKMLDHAKKINLKTVYQAIDGKLRKPVLKKLDGCLSTFPATQINSIIKEQDANHKKWSQIMTILCCLLIIPIFFAGAIYRRFLNSKANIHDYAMYGQFDKIVYLMHKDPRQINRKDAHGNTALTLAASKGHLEIVKYLVEQGANKDAQNSVGSTALTLAASAASKGHLEIVKYLVEQGANKDAQNSVGSTALTLAASKGHLEIVKYLVEQGANKDAQNNRGSTALIIAAFQGHLDIVKYLVGQGANKDAQNNLDDTALTLAAYKGHLGIVKYLVAHEANTNIKGEEGQTALQWAQKMSRTDVVKFLQELAKNRVTYPSINATPIHVEPLAASSFSNATNQKNVFTIPRDRMSIVPTNRAPIPSAPLY